MLKRTGHFWEKRYFAEGFPNTDQERALNTLRYIHGNPKAAKMQEGFFYDFSNYGSYECLTDDGLTQWHPAFLRLGNTLSECARKYKGFCSRLKSKKKSPRKCHWGSRFLGDVVRISGEKRRSTKPQFPFPPCQLSKKRELTRVVNQFVRANRPNVVESRES